LFSCDFILGGSKKRESEGQEEAIGFVEEKAPPGMPFA